MGSEDALVVFSLRNLKLRNVARSPRRAIKMRLRQKNSAREGRCPSGRRRDRKKIQAE
jgi:hypothetical protein